MTVTHCRDYQRIAFDAMGNRVDVFLPDSVMGRVFVKLDIDWNADYRVGCNHLAYWAVISESWSMGLLFI